MGVDGKSIGKYENGTNVPRGFAVECRRKSLSAQTRLLNQADSYVNSHWACTHSEIVRAGGILVILPSLPELPGLGEEMCIPNYCPHDWSGWARSNENTESDAIAMSLWTLVVVIHGIFSIHNVKQFIDHFYACLLNFRAMQISVKSKEWDILFGKISSLSFFDIKHVEIIIVFINVTQFFYYYIWSLDINHSI